MGNESFPILKTKLYIPPRRADWIDRPVLLARLTEAAQRQQLTLVSARPGSGKTSLVSAWLRQQTRPAAWLSLDASDNDPRRFLTGLLEALHPLGVLSHPRQGSMLDALTFSASTPSAVTMQAAPLPGTGLESGGLPAPELVMAELINDLAAHAEPFTLVLDDYHVIQTPWIHTALAFLIEHQPPTLHLILLTRVDPPFALALLRGRGRLAEIRDQDLQFTAAEAETFLNGVMALGLTEAAVTTIEQRTEGWIAGLQMAAISMQGRKPGSELNKFIQAFSGTHRFILDYLIEAVLNQQPPEVQEFLIETAILDRMCSDLCDAVWTGSAISPGGSQAMLAQLERSNLFVISLDDDRHWYRYHHLFADLLRSVLRQRRSAEAIRALHRRAGRWFEAQAALEETMQHTLAAQDYEHAAAIIDANLVHLFTQTHPEQLLHWIKELPETVIRERPWLDVYYATTLVFLGLLDGVDARLATVEQGFQTVEEDTRSSNPQQDQILGHVAVVRGYAANLRGDGATAIAQAELARQRLPDTDWAVRGMAAYTLADTYFWQDDMEHASDALADLLHIGEKNNQALMTVTALCTQANIAKVQGRLHQAETLYQRALRSMEAQNSLDLRVRCAYEFGLADLLREWNQLDRALEHAVFGAERLKRLGGYLVESHLTLMRIYQARGEVENALRSLHAAEKDMHSYQFQLSTQVEFHTAQIEQYLALGDVEAASRWAKALQAGAEKEQIALARLYLAQGRAAETLPLLNAQQARAEAGGRVGRVIEMVALKSLALSALGRVADADAALAQAWALAQPEGFQQVFLSLGLPLSAGQAEASIPPSLAVASKTIRRAALENSDWRNQGATAKTPTESLYEELTGREIEVLRLLAEGLPNKAIADQLVVAPSTIKQHLKNICRKLGVHNRTQAVARGRALKLL